MNVPMNVLTTSDSCETIDQSASRLIDDVMTSTNEEQLMIAQRSWRCVLR